LQIGPFAARLGLQVDFLSPLVGRHDAGADRFLQDIYGRRRIHAQKAVEVEFRAEALSHAKAFIEAKLGVLDEALQALRIILDIERLDIVVGGHRPDADLVGRDMEG